MPFLIYFGTLGPILFGLLLFANYMLTPQSRTAPITPTAPLTTASIPPASESAKKSPSERASSEATIGPKRQVNLRSGQTADGVSQADQAVSAQASTVSQPSPPPAATGPEPATVANTKTPTKKKHVAQPVPARDAKSAKRAKTDTARRAATRDSRRSSRPFQRPPRRQYEDEDFDFAYAGRGRYPRVQRSYRYAPRYDAEGPIYRAW
jgi:hypothetical protein